MRLVNPNVLEDEMTIEDPVTLARPWTVKIRYRRVTDHLADVDLRLHGE